MRAILSGMVLLTSVGVMASDIIPVNTWPKIINTEDKVIHNPTAQQCVNTGYRLKPDAKPATPGGKQIKSETLVQDGMKSSYVKWVIEYEDIPEPPPPPPPEVLIKVSADKVEFIFTESGSYRGVNWLDAPKTNDVVK